MIYDLDDFSQDCARALLCAPAYAEALEQVRACLARLVANPVFAHRVCGPEAPAGLHRLYEAGPGGFQVLAHVNQKARTGPPHDHGDSWAVYGQVVGYTDMTLYQRVDDRSHPGFARLKVIKRYRLGPGEVGVYAGGVIHSIDYPGGSRFIRVTGTDLDQIERRAFDLGTGEIRRALPQRAS